MAEYLLYEGNNKIEAGGDNVWLTFFTSGSRLIIKHRTSEAVSGNFPHVGITARVGLAVLLRNVNEMLEPTSAWKPVELLANKEEEAVNLSHIVPKGTKYQIGIYGPILAQLVYLSVQTEEGAYFSFGQGNEQNCTTDKKVQFLAVGGKHTFGIGVTSTAMMYSNILRRNYKIHLDRMASFHKQTVKENLENLVRVNALNSYDVVIYEIGKFESSETDFVSNFNCLLNQMSGAKKILLWHAWDEKYLRKNPRIIELLNEYIPRYGNIEVLNFDYFFQQEYADKYTYSTNFLNDAANVHIYGKFEEILRNEIWNT